MTLTIPFNTVLLISRYGQLADHMADFLFDQQLPLFIQNQTVLELRQIGIAFGCLLV
jgi:hypothetical protein